VLVLGLEFLVFCLIIKPFRAIFKILFFIDMADNQDKRMAQKEFIRKGLMLFLELSSWLVGPIIAALLLGNWLDRHYQTKPWLFLVCLGVAFIITCLGIAKETKSFIREIEQSAPKKDS
jgi:F0F1-type ATP synthase assembly protein I